MLFDSQSDLAAIVYKDGPPPDDLLRTFATDLVARGFKPVGLIQNGRNCHSAPAFSVTALHSGENLQLIQERGKEARGCKLDVARLLDAGMRVAAAMDHGADILIINRFGKQEQDGKGLLFLIEKAMTLGIPVLIAVARARFDGWISFSSGMSVMLRPDRSSLERWWTSVAQGRYLLTAVAQPARECHAMMRPAADTDRAKH
jgi:hypothetical protein